MDIVIWADGQDYALTYDMSSLRDYVKLVPARRYILGLDAIQPRRDEI